MKSVIKTLAVLAVLAVVAVPVVVYSGLFNVAATWEDPAPVAWVLHGTYRNSVEARANSIEPPADLKSETRILQGARNYLAMCSGCHTPPGLSATPVSQGLNPSPPDLADIIPHRTSAEAFWVIKNGVRMTGMPAFGATHKDEELWALVAFLQANSDATPEAYESLIARANQSAPASDGHGHRHGNEPAPASGDHTSETTKNHGAPGHHSKNGTEERPPVAEAGHAPPGQHDRSKTSDKQANSSDDSHDHQH